jgi:hypothetical protein
MQATARASVKRLVRMGETLGVSSESISSRRSGEDLSV